MSEHTPETRVNASQIMAVMERWKKVNPKGLERQWRADVEYSTRKKFDVAKVIQWTIKDLNRVNRGIDGVYL